MSQRVFPDRSRPGAWVVRVGDTDQSYVDPADPTHLEFEYVQRIADLVDLLAPAGERLRVLHVGGGGLTLPRYIAATRPMSAQVVFEPDAELTAEVRERAPLPVRSGIKVRPVDGLSGIAAVPNDYADLVIVDAFVGARVPAELVTQECFAELDRVLVAGGALIMNVTDQAPFTYTRRVVAGLAELGREVVLSAEPATLKGRRFGNVVLFAGPELDLARLRRSAAAAAFPYRVLTGADLKSLVGRAYPFTASESEQSPPPPATLFKSTRRSV